MSFQDEKNKVVTTEDILLKLCQSVSGVLTSATSSQINYSAMVQKINKTSLKPDFGCFVLFDGGFTGLVVINFTAKAALEIYTNYMRNMGMPEEELAISHTSDEVGDVLGELMNQLVGDFTNKIRKELQTNITQNQPKMLSLNKQVILQVDTNLDRPQARRVTFSTANNNIFYLELAMDKTEFIQLEEFEVAEDESPDDILEATRKSMEDKKAAEPASNKSDADDLLDQLGL
ncbi:chemotaxis protein CheX [Vibrio campbellii]|nr:chemotaxis protein CheX [Vibrio campbellii]